MIIFIVPKNSGLRDKVDEILKRFSGEIVEVRGEDVPNFVAKFSKENKKVIGITGEDLFKEFMINNKGQRLEILDKINWKDDNFLFQKPTLCLLGPRGKILQDLGKNLRICINSKYKELAKKGILGILENKGYRLEEIYVNGASEEFFTKGLADFVIDIVCSGKSAKGAGLEVYEKIFSSDIVIIGKREEEFDLEKLYNKICKKINSNDKNSYTKQLISNPNKLKRKLIEEAGEVITADSRENLIWECSDLIYFLFVIMANEGITIEDIERENERRDKETLINNNNLNKIKEEVNKNEK